jgi:MFS family permease
MPDDGTTSADPDKPLAAGTGSAEAGTRARQPRGLSTTFRSLRHRNYRLYFFGQLISLTGTWMQSTAVSWLAFTLTHESKWTALIMVAQILPTFLFGAWGGVLADRVPKRTVIFCTQSAFLLLALLLAALGYAGLISAWQLVVVTAAGGVVQALDLPSRLAFVMDMASREDLMNAVALNSLLFNVARALGPAAGGQLMRWISPETCFLANAVSYLAVLWALGNMDVTGSARIVTQGAGLKALLNGLTFVARRRQLLLLALLMAVVSFCGWPSQSLLPALAKNHLHSDEVGYGNMLSGTGVGALIAAWAVATFGSLERRRRLLAAGVAMVVVGLLSLSLADRIGPETRIVVQFTQSVSFSVAASLAFAVCCSGLLGFGLILFLATSQSIIQLSAGDHNRGRVMAVWAMIQSGAVPLGSILAGAASDAWGVPVVLRILGFGCLASTVALTCFFAAAASPPLKE